MEPTDDMIDAAREQHESGARSRDESRTMIRDLRTRLAAAEAAVLMTEQRAFYAAERAVKDWLELHFERECDWREHSGLESVAWDAYHAMVAAEARIDTTLRGNASGKED